MVTSHRSGGYVLGFRAETPKKLQEIHDCIEKLRTAVAKRPDLGVRFTSEETVRIPFSAQFSRTLFQTSLECNNF